MDLSYAGNMIRVRAESNMINLTDMWKAEGSPKTKRVNDWLNNVQTAELITQLELELSHNTTSSCIIESRRGKGGGTYGASKLALAYAEYLSPAFHSWALGAVQQVLEADPNLTTDLIARTKSGEDFDKVSSAYSERRQKQIEQWRSEGKDDKWIAVRIEVIDSHKEFSNSLQQHGATAPWQYANCVDELNQPILGAKSKELKKQRGLAKSASLRDTNTRTENAALILAQSLSEDILGAMQADKYKQCVDVCDKVGQHIADTIHNARTLPAHQPPNYDHPSKGKKLVKSSK